MDNGVDEDVDSSYGHSHHPSWSQQVLVPLFLLQTPTNILPTATLIKHQREVCGCSCNIPPLTTILIFCAAKGCLLDEGLKDRNNFDAVTGAGRLHPPARSANDH